MTARPFTAVGLATAIALVGPAAAQTLSGTVTDSATGRALVGAVVSIRGTTKQVATSATGRCLILEAPAGRITLRAAMIGYGPVIRVVTLTEGEDATADVALALRPIDLEELVAIGYGSIARENLGSCGGTIVFDPSNTGTISAILAVSATPGGNVSSTLSGLGF